MKSLKYRGTKIREMRADIKAFRKATVGGKQKLKYPLKTWEQTWVPIFVSLNNSFNSLLLDYNFFQFVHKSRS